MATQIKEIEKDVYQIDNKADNDPTSVTIDPSEFKSFDGERGFDIIEKKQCLNYLTFQPQVGYRIKLTTGYIISLVFNVCFLEQTLTEEDFIQNILIKLGLLGVEVTE